jgi:PEP-CTERM motif
MAGALLSGALTAPAAIVNIPLGTVTETSATAGGVLILPQFNNSLGTLTGVTLSFGTGSVAANIGISDLEPAGGNISITYDLGYEVTFNFPGGFYNPQVSQNLTCSGFGVEISSCNNSSALAGAGLTSSVDLSSFAALFEAGNVDVPYTPSLIEQVVGSTVPASPSNLVLSVTGENLIMPASLTYTYNSSSSSAPEPSSFVLLGAGLLAVGWARRKRSIRLPPAA